MSSVADNSHTASVFNESTIFYINSNATIISLDFQRTVEQLHVTVRNVDKVDLTLRELGEHGCGVHQRSLTFDKAYQTSQ